jgi:hypothetical protein
MKPMFFTLIACLLVFVTGCASFGKNDPEAASPPATATPTAPQVSTAQGSGQAAPLPSVTPGSGAAPVASATLPADGITLSENGLTYSMKVGDDFLLNLGADVYDWTVEIDRQDVLLRKAGVTVIRGAQGVYSANAPGTAVLTANGDPRCLQSKPPCKLPSISFHITLIVK